MFHCYSPVVFSLGSLFYRLRSAAMGPGFITWKSVLCHYNIFYSWSNFVYKIKLHNDLIQRHVREFDLLTLLIICLNLLVLSCWMLRYYMQRKKHCFVFACDIMLGSHTMLHFILTKSCESFSISICPEGKWFRNFERFQVFEWIGFTAEIWVSLYSPKIIVFSFLLFISLINKSFWNVEEEFWLFGDDKGHFTANTCLHQTINISMTVKWIAW